MTNGEKFKTAKERAEAFCHDNEITKADELLNIRQVFNWLDLEAPAEEPLPCPFCGGKVEVVYHSANGLTNIECKERECWYASALKADKSAAIAAHNRVARAANEKEANDAVRS